jgi:pimeloyl-ACP methyl ester carboxylesterase
MNLELLRIPTAGTSGNAIATLAYEARRPRSVTIVAGHGYSSSKHNLDSLCAFLASHGFSMYSLDFPGHKLGASGGHLGSADDLIDAMSSVVRVARERGAQTIYTLGHSMGAATALCVAGNDPSIAGAVSIATGWGRPQALAALTNKGAVDLRSAYVDGASLPEIVDSWLPLLEAALPQLAGRPTLFVAADRDGLVSQSSVKELFEQASEPKTFSVVSGDHTFAGENARGTILEWLAERHAR